MNEVKQPKKPLIFYYLVVMLILALFNSLAMPWLLERQIQEVDYGTFMSMTENKDIGRVDVQKNQIVFTNKEENKIFKTGLMEDPGRTDRLYAAGAEFSSEIVQETSPFLSFVLTWILPLLMFAAIGQFMSRKMMDKMGGPNALSFNKSNAKVYVKSSDGISFADVEGVDEAEESLAEIVDYPANTRKSAPPCPRACCWLALRAPAKPCWQRPWPVNPMSPSSP